MHRTTRRRPGGATPAGALGCAAALSALAACTPPPVLLPAPPPPALAASQVIDAAVAAVGLHTIALSEVRLACDLARVREASSPVDVAGLGPCPRALEEETVEQLVNQALILEDAARFNVEVPPEAVDARFAALEAKLAGPAGFERFLARHGLDHGALRERLAREVLLGRYLDRRIGLLVFVTPDEVAAFYEANRERFEGADLATAEPQIRAYLQRAKYRDALMDYIQSLRARADVRRLSPRRPEEPEAPRGGPHGVVLPGGPDRPPHEAPYPGLPRGPRGAAGSAGWIKGARASGADGCRLVTRGRNFLAAPFTRMLKFAVFATRSASTSTSGATP